MNVHSSPYDRQKLVGSGAAIATALLVGITVLNSCGNAQRTLSPKEIAQRCEKASTKLYEVDHVGDGSKQLHAPIDERSYGTAVLAPDEEIGRRKAQKILFGASKVGKLAFAEANPQLGSKSKIDKDHPARAQISSIDSFIVTGNGDEDRDSETKSSIGKIAKDTGIDIPSIECLSGFNAQYKPGENERYKVFVPRQILGKEVEGYSPVVLRASDNIQVFASKLTVAKNVSLNGVQPTDFRAGTILYKKKSAKTESAPNPTEQYEAPAGDIKTFLERYQDKAKLVEKKYGVPSDLVLAQGLLESDYGRSELAVKAFNFHGLKANDQWNGPTYTKTTQEVVDRKRQQREFPNAKILSIRGDQKLVIEVSAAFKKFNSAEEGFLEYGNYLKNRGPSDAKFFADAFQEKDPLKFVKRLVDGKGQRYATDPEYVGKISRVLARIRTAATPDYQTVHPPTEFSEYPTTQQQFGLNTAYKRAPLGVADGSEKTAGDLKTSEQRFEASKRSIEAAQVSKKGYDIFKQVIKRNDISQELEKKYPRNFGDHRKPATLNEPKYFILHFTANSPQANSYDGRTFAGTMHNAGFGTGANYYINDQGAPYKLSNRYVDHIFTYSQESFGLEIAASEQATIKPVQYEAAIYTAAYFLIERGYLKEGDDIKKIVDQTVRGHGDIRSQADDHTDFPKPIVDAFNTKLVSFIKKDLGY